MLSIYGRWTWILVYNLGCSVNLFTFYSKPFLAGLGGICSQSLLGTHTNCTNIPRPPKGQTGHHWEVHYSKEWSLPAHWFCCSETMVGAWGPLYLGPSISGHPHSHPSQGPDNLKKFMCLCLVAQLCPTPCDLSGLHPSMGIFRQEYWSGLPFPPPGDLPDPGIKPGLLHCRWILSPSHWWNPSKKCTDPANHRPATLFSLQSPGCPWALLAHKVSPLAWPPFWTSASSLQGYQLPLLSALQKYPRQKKIHTHVA